MKSSQSEIDAYENSFKKGNWLVRYHASWCGHCINMSQEWSDFVSNNKNKKVKIISIEQEAMDRLKRKPQNFRGFPSIIFFNISTVELEFKNLNLSMQRNKINELKNRLQLLIKKETYWRQKEITLNKIR